MSDANLESSEFVPIPSIGHELGIMFGFIGLMLVSMILYVFAWQYGNRVGARREAERIEALKASGWLKEKQELSGSDEKREYTEIPM